MRALLSMAAILMGLISLCATYMALGDLMDPYKLDKGPAIILWLIIILPTWGLVHLAFFRRRAA